MQQVHKSQEMVISNAQSSGESEAPQQSLPEPDEKTEAAGQSNSEATPPPQLPPVELSEAEQIRFYRQQGLTFEQLVKELGFKPSTVREEIAKELVANNDAEEEKTSALPLVLKNGKGEMISPEAVYYQLAAEDGVNGERDFKALMKWAASIELVQRMTEIRKGEAEAFAASIKPMLEMMDRSRQELDAAAARARESSMAMAEAAAAGAAARATMRIDERFDELKESKKEKADIATVPDPMKGLMARTMETMMNQLSGMLFKSQVGPTPGLVDKRIQEEK